MHTLPFFCPSILVPSPPSQLVLGDESEPNERVSIELLCGLEPKIRRDAAPLGAHWHGVAWPSGTDGRRGYVDDDDD